MRNPETHDEYTGLLEGACGSADSITYGINHASCFNRLPDFHVASFQMPQDVMHVLLEGVLPLNIRLMLDGFINDGMLTVDELNQRVQYFKYGRVEAKTKPPKPFERKHFTRHLHLSGI